MFGYPTTWDPSTEFLVTLMVDLHSNHIGNPVPTRPCRLTDLCQTMECGCVACAENLDECCYQIDHWVNKWEQENETREQGSP